MKLGRVEKRRRTLGRIRGSWNTRELERRESGSRRKTQERVRSPDEPLGFDGGSGGDHGTGLGSDG